MDSLLGGQWVLAVLVGGELLVQVLLGELLTPFFLSSEALGYGEEGHDGVVIQRVNLHLVQNLQRIRQCLGHIAEDGVHLGLRLEPLLFGIEHARGVIQVLASGHY